MSESLPLPPRDVTGRPAPRERITPQSMEGEQSTLGAMLMETDAIARAIEYPLVAEDFYRDRHRKIFLAIVALFEAGTTVDIISAGQELRKRGQLEEIDGAAYLTALIESCPSAANIDAYMKPVKEAAILRRLLRASEEISAMAYGDVDNAGTVAERAEAMLMDINHQAPTQAFEPLSALLAEECQAIYQASENKGTTTGLATGFYRFDDYTSGLQPTDLIILAARPSMGKTGLALQVAMRVALQGLNVAVFSLEMSKRQLVRRILSTEASVNSRALRTGFISDEEWERLESATDRIINAPLHILDTCNISTVAMRSQCRRLAARTGPLALIVVDYLQLMRYAGKHDNRVHEVSEIARALKALAREHDCPVLALSQLSRAVEQREDKRPMLSDLRESGSIEAEADVVTFLYRPAYYHRKVEERPAWGPEVLEEAELIIGKQRNGPVGMVPLGFQADFARFVNPEN